ncbi:peptidase [Paenibacillus darwinianus]|uniref:Peptidase n=1 Tax=Paenibacillus darwinianus TaxID=1380763 RepID=A0A9W5RZ88_9BACL|nr:peptidase [Paenibacillus darwinianus]EXX86387.1 peptidase [Paenibacillus darwinianus]EXX90996.1 peptidase [Paenibacillus darwinianus]
MKLTELKGSYDAIYSLGDLCLAAIQLEKNGLRPFAGPLDWMSSPNLTDVNRLLANRFAGFMDYHNLSVVGKASERLYLVRESAYNVYSNHDFFTHNNFPPHLAAYPEVKAKYDRRVARFLEKTTTAECILFIRTVGTWEQATALEAVLSALVVHDFRVLLVNHTAVLGLVEDDCSLPNVCAVQLPDNEIWKGHDRIWTELLTGIRLKEN